MSKNTEMGEQNDKTESTVTSDVYAEEIDLREVFAAIWRAKWIVVGITAVSVLLSVLLALWLPNQYKASAILAPASTSSTSALTQLAGQFGGLASLAGVNLGGAGGADEAVIAIELVKSWSFLDQFIKDNHIEVEVFAATGWDRINNRLQIDPDIYDVSQKKWVRKFSPEKGETAEPSSWELYEKLVDRIEIDQDKKTGLVNLSVEYYSPILAKEWTGKLVMSINKLLQEQDRKEASRSIEFLNKQIDRTSVSDMKTVFYKLVEEQTKNLMLAEVNEEYALKTLSEAKVPEEKSKPNRAVICVLGTMLGLLVALFVILFRSNVSAKK